MKARKLAIVLPAYKGRFLKDTLDSIAAQTCQDFTLYVGDDASPEPLQAIVRAYASRIQVVYHRFDDNLGRKDLVAHWERCIALSTEPLVWLFSDDDLMPADGVERVLAAAATTGLDRVMFRLPLQVVDADGRVKFRNRPLPAGRTSGYDLLLAKMEGRLHSAAIEYVFSRDVCQGAGGFVHFPMAWCSDDATWAAFADYTGGIIPVPGDPVCWRNAEGSNISNTAAYNAEKLHALILFLQWLKEKYPDHCGDKRLRRALYAYLATNLRQSIQGHFSLMQLQRLVRATRHIDTRAAGKVWLHHVLKIQSLI